MERGESQLMLTKVRAGVANMPREKLKGRLLNMARLMGMGGHGSSGIRPQQHGASR